MATMVAYAPALRAPFFFDDAVIGRDSTSQVLWPLTVPLHPTPQTAVSGRPVVNYTLALNYRINQVLGVDQAPNRPAPNETVSYHILNILFHLACGSLLLGTLRRTFRSQRYGAWFADHADVVALAIAGIWMVHPLLSEAVDYTIQRTELIVSLCYVGTLYASIRAWDTRTARARLGWYAAATLTCLLGMGSKEVMVSAPLMVVLYDRAFRWTSWRQIVSGGRLWFYIALGATSIWLITLIASGGRSDTVGFGLGTRWWEYCVSQGWAIPHYVRLFLWPSDLSVDYGWNWVIGPGSFAGLAVLTALAIATVAAWVRVERWGWLGFLGAWFLLLLAPSSSVVPITTEVAAERRIYLALVSVVIIVVIGADAAFRHLLRKTSRAGTAHMPWMRAAFVVVGLVLAATTYERSRTYVDLETLWRDVTAHSATNPRGWDNLARQMLFQNPPREAEADAALHRAITVDSMYFPAWYNLALIAIQQGRLNDARLDLEHALRGDPNNVQTIAQYGNLLVRIGAPARAIPYLERLAFAAPGDQTLVDVGRAYAAAGRLSDAGSTFRAALRLNPNSVDARDALAAVLAAEHQPAVGKPPL